MIRVALTLTAITLALPAPQTPVLADVLRSAGEYVAAFERKLPGLVLDEQYLQRILLPNEDPRQRALRAQVVLTLDAKAGWTAFRDVLQVDGKIVRERDDRLPKLLRQPTPQTLATAKEITAESGRQALTPEGIEFKRLLDEPLTPLTLLRAANQSRAVFRLDGIRRYVGVDVIVLRFTERGKPRLLATADDAPASGTFWIDPASGGVLSCDLAVDTKSRGLGVTAGLRIAYEFQRSLGVLVPVTMDEQYDLLAGPRALRIEGRSTYSQHAPLRPNISLTAALR